MTGSEALSPELVLVCPELRADAYAEETLDAEPPEGDDIPTGRAWMLPAVPFGVAALAILTYAAAALVP